MCAGVQTVSKCANRCSFLLMTPLSFPFLVPHTEGRVRDGTPPPSFVPPSLHLLSSAPAPPPSRPLSFLPFPLHRTPSSFLCAFLLSLLPSPICLSLIFSPSFLILLLSCFNSVTSFFPSLHFLPPFMFSFTSFHHFLPPLHLLRFLPSCTSFLHFNSFPPSLHFFSTPPSSHQFLLSVKVHHFFSDGY